MGTTLGTTLVLVEVELVVPVEEVDPVPTVEVVPVPLMVVEWRGQVTQNPLLMK